MLNFFICTASIMQHMGNVQGRTNIAVAGCKRAWSCSPWKYSIFSWA